MFIHYLLVCITIGKLPYKWLKKYFVTTNVFRIGFTPGPSQGALLSKSTAAAFPWFVSAVCCPLANVSLQLAADKCHHHAGNPERGSRGGWGENQRRWRDAHDSVEQPAAQPQPTAAVCHLHKHAVPPKHRGHG